eukprot:1161911-Pelagomonas_calceolata.AAC.4
MRSQLATQVWWYAWLMMTAKFWGRSSGSWAQDLMITGSEATARFPGVIVCSCTQPFFQRAGYQVPADWPALYQPLAGILLPEKCIQGLHTMKGHLGKLNTVEHMGTWQLLYVLST